MNLVQCVFEILSPLGVPIYWQLRPEEFPSITYEFIDEAGVLYGDGKEIQTGVQCQVDVWSKSDYTELVDRVIEIMRVNGFIRSRASDDFEKVTKIYHKVIIFNFEYRTEGENNGR